MEGHFERSAAVEPPFEILTEGEQRLAMVLSSPHSGKDYPAEFLAASRLDPVTLRRSEDCFVDEIFGGAPGLGAPLLRARFPRAFLDPNREPYELDPAMFEDALPDYVNGRSPRVRVGLGTIARVVASGEEIYRRRLRFSDAVERIERLYHPYHRALRQLLAATQEKFGHYILLDCHSMPSANGSQERAAQRNRVDIVLGDCHGTACHAIVTDTAHQALRDKGYTLARNIPYAGGFTTLHYGTPGSGGHSLQIEISRGLYMNERTFQRKPHFSRLASDMQDLVSALAAIDPAALVPAA
jgi:N-formylglutamate amidohydrolase